MKENELEDNHALQRYFNQRLREILESKARYMVGWDEILQPDLPKTIVIQSWRGRESLYQTAQKGYQGILSNGYYIDLCKPAAHHYLNDPLPPDAPLNDEEKKRVLGGEATMWAELVTPETVDSRIWPRTAAIAERFWSPAEVKDVEDMYRRLDIISRQLEDIGLTHVRNRRMMMERVWRGGSIAPLEAFVSYVEPLKVYDRHYQGVDYSTDLSFTRLPDIAIPDAPGARKFNRRVEAYLSGDLSQRGNHDLRMEMGSWAGIHEKLTERSKMAPHVKEMLPLSGNLSSLGELGIEAMDYIDEKKSPEGAWKKEGAQVIKDGKTSYLESELMVIAGVEKLVEAALKQ